MKGWVLGVLLTIVSAAGSTSGLILQKIAHTREQKAVKDGIKTNTLKCFDIPCNKYFIAGFIMLAFVPLPFDFVALANAGQSIILPVGTGCTVIFGQLLAPKILGEKLTNLDIVATFFITLGTVLSMATGTHESPTYTANRLLYLYTLTPFIIAMVFIAITTTICLIVAHVPKLEEKLWASAKIPILAYIPSSLGAVQIMVFKVVGELTKNTFTGYEESYVDTSSSSSTNSTNGINYKTRMVKTNEFLNPILYLYVFLVITLAVAQLSYLNRGLSKYNAIKFLPIYNTLLLMVGVTCGAIYFQEYDAFHPVWFPIGCLLEMSGIFALAWKMDDDDNKNNENVDTESNSNSSEKIVTESTTSNLTKILPS